MPQERVPWWETAVMVGSFVLLWVWFVARQLAYKTPEGRMWPGWHVLLLLSLVALVVITMRRVKRVQRALRGDQANRFPPHLPHSNGKPH